MRRRNFSSYSDALEYYAGEGYSAHDARLYAGKGVAPKPETDEDDDNETEEEE